MDREGITTGSTRLREDIYAQETFGWFYLLQAFGGRDQVGRDSRHEGENGKWMAGSSKEVEEKKAQNHKRSGAWLAQLV